MTHEPLTAENTLDLLRDFLREWYPGAKVEAIKAEGRGEIVVVTVRAESGTDPVMESCFEVADNQMTTNGVFQLASKMRHDWRGRLLAAGMGEP